jgi:hypothetical protein
MIKLKKYKKLGPLMLESKNIFLFWFKIRKIKKAIKKDQRPEKIIYQNIIFKSWKNQTSQKTKTKMFFKYKIKNVFQRQKQKKYFIMI